MTKQNMQLVLAIFDTDAAAKTAADRLKQWDKATPDVKAGAVGVIAKDVKGNVKEESLGPRKGKKGAEIGVVLGVIAAVPTGGLSLLGGAVGGAVGGGVVGELFHKHLGLSDEDRARIGKEIDGGKAAVGVLVEANAVAAFTAKLQELGGKPETHEVTAEGMEKATAQGKNGAAATDANLAAQDATQPVPWLVGEGLELAEQGLYHLPRDHAWHSGPTYYADDYFEWHYFTFLGKDKGTGHDVSLFLCVMSQGWSKALNRPVMFTFFAWHDKVTGEFVGTTFVPMSKFESSGSSMPDFGFKYAINDPDEKGFATSYDYAQEQWNFKSFCTDKSKLAGEGKPYAMDVTGVVQAPGYVPSAYWGLESIGFNKNFNQNPETMYGLTYYYTAPQIEMTGTVTLADGIHEIEGVAWLEHQWGNFRNTEQSRYFWGYARFDNGDAITWRQYYGNPVGKKDVEVPFDLKAARAAWDEPHPEVNRFAFIPKGQAPEYSFGPTYLFTPIKWWTSPSSGVEYPWWGEMKTPQGTFYLSPTFPAQESTALAGSFIEGALLLRKDSIDGPVVAQGFCELVQLPARGAPFTRELPERKADLEFNGGLKRK